MHEFLSEVCLFTGLLSCSGMLWSPGVPLMGAKQSLHLGRIGLAFLSKLFTYYGKEGTFLEEILCAEQMRRCSTREPCRHQPVPGVVCEDTGIQKSGWQGGIKEKQKWQSNGFSSGGHQPSFSLREPGLQKPMPGFVARKPMFSFQVWVRWEVPLKLQSSGISFLDSVNVIACLRCARYYEIKGGS